jgi:hypothetical protein
MIKSFYFRRAELGNKWSETEPFRISAELTGRHSEGEHTQCIVKLAVPISFGDEIFDPLCKEFPASPGIDVVYLGCHGTLALIECEIEQYKKPIQSLGHFALAGGGFKGFKRIRKCCHPASLLFVSGGSLPDTT